MTLKKFIKFDDGAPVAGVGGEDLRSHGHVRDKQLEGAASKACG